MPVKKRATQKVKDEAAQKDGARIGDKFQRSGGLPDQDVIDLVDALSRLSPSAARRATKLMSGVVRTVSR